MIEFRGERVLELPLHFAAAKLSDASFLVRGIPNSEVVGQPSATLAQCVVAPNLAFAKGKLETKIEVAEAVPLASVRYVIASKGVGAHAEVEIRILFSAVDKSTRVEWTAAITKLGGLLKMVPSGLIRGAAGKVLDDILDSVAARLSAESAQGVP